MVVQVTGEKGNLFKEMQMYKRFDADNHGALSEEDFLDGWARLANEQEGRQVLPSSAAPPGSLPHPPLARSLTSPARQVLDKMRAFAAGASSATPGPKLTMQSEKERSPPERSSSGYVSRYT